MISYQNITAAETYYKYWGFEFIEVPWVVGEQAINITAPPLASKYFLGEGYLVASGEQSFLQLILDGKLPKGAYGCITACFRDDKVDLLHRRWFMKVELIDTADTSMKRLNKITQLCHIFFDDIIPGSKVIKTHPVDPLLIDDTARDIVSPQEIELGSYGIRQHPDIGQWVYATGCAEPRLSVAKKLSTSSIG